MRRRSGRDVDGEARLPPDLGRHLGDPCSARRVGAADARDPDSDHADRGKVATPVRRRPLAAEDRVGVSVRIWIDRREVGRIHHRPQALHRREEQGRLRDVVAEVERRAERPSLEQRPAPRVGAGERRRVVGLERHSRQRAEAGQRRRVVAADDPEHRDRRVAVGLEHVVSLAGPKAPELRVVIPERGSLVAAADRARPPDRDRIVNRNDPQAVAAEDRVPRG